jgi:type VI secretion system secreted protein VgrG
MGLGGSQGWIRQGDPVEGGGEVTGASGFPVGGKLLMLEGDMARCDTHGGSFPAVQGDDGFIVDGRRIVLDTHRLACGCRLRSTCNNQWGHEPSPASRGISYSNTPLSWATADSTPQYDEAIRFLGPGDNPLAHMEFVLHLEDGRTIAGTTDDAGRTGRIETAIPTGIVRAELTVPTQEEGCCSLIGMPAQTVAMMELRGVVTNGTSLGSSVKDVRLEQEDRGLTNGEIAMLRPIFDASVDYSQVRIHNHGYWMFFGFQKKGTAVTPNGELYMPGDLFLPDYSAAADTMQHLFVHEMVHVWQYQLGYPIKWVRTPQPTMSYRYTLSPEKRLFDYNMEAQGNLIADYFLFRWRSNIRDVREALYKGQPVRDVLPLYESVLRDFLLMPGRFSHLPRSPSTAGYIQGTPL